jgi:hypothetical protein
MNLQDAQRKFTLPSHLAVKRLHAGEVVCDVKIGTVYGTSNYSVTHVAGSNNQVSSLVTHHTKCWVRFPGENDIEMNFSGSKFSVADEHILAVLKVAVRPDLGTTEDLGNYALYNITSGQHINYEIFDSMSSQANFSNIVGKLIGPELHKKEMSTASLSVGIMVLVGLLVGIVIGSTFKSFLAGMISAAVAGVFAFKFTPGMKAPPQIFSQVIDHIDQVHATLLDRLKERNLHQ